MFENKLNFSSDVHLTWTLFKGQKHNIPILMKSIYCLRSEIIENSNSGSQNILVK